MADYLKNKGFVYESDFDASQGEPLGTYSFKDQGYKYSVFLSKVYTRFFQKINLVTYKEENINLSRLKVLLRGL
jgi:hypothetical protein